MEADISRRFFLKGAAVSAAGMAGVASLVACGPKDSQSSADEDSDSWDYESDIVIVGSGSGLIGALLATSKGYTVTVAEKAPLLGGTTIMSSCGSWIPCNRWIADTEFGPGWTEEEALAYLTTADLYRGSTQEEKIDYIRNYRKVAEYFEDTWGYDLVSGPEFANYDKGPFGDQKGNVVFFADGEGGTKMGADVFDMFIPTLEERGATLLTDTRVTSLIQDESGHVIGVKAKGSEGEIRIKGDKGVLLAAGGFDHSKEMREKYLRGPIFTSFVPMTNEGDGIHLGQAIGADLGNMQVSTGANIYVDQYDGPEDWNTYMKAADGINRSAPYGVLVNKRGRRFMDESTAYSIYSDSVAGFDSRDTSHMNIPAYFIFTDRNVALAGWPGGSEEKPEWIDEFDSLDELAAAYGIDADNLKAEIERFNGFCQTGVDVDFGRGDAPYAASYAQVSDITEGNKCLGPVEPPYYVTMSLPASYGTRGGLKVDMDARVLDVEGEVIPGLYCSGCNSSGILGSTYGGAGGGVGPGFYRSFRAVNDALDLNEIAWS